jgi:MFS transporter, DHA2 family, multidrug resistance protein
VPVVLAVLVVGLDATILSIALPTLGRELDASTGQLQWFVAAYTLVFAAALVPGGMLGDRYGRKRMLIVSLVLFGAASVACALAPSANAFIAARALLGLGGAILFPMVLGLLPVLFDESERPRAIAAVTTAAMLGYPIGPLLGGWMLTRFDWTWVFLINLPVVALALAAAIFLLPETRSSVRRRVDFGGIVLSVAGLALLTYGVINAGDRGWTDGAALMEMVGGTIVLGAFVLWERHVATPLVDPGLFRSSAFTWGTTLSSLVSFAMFGLLFSVPLYFQVVRGTDTQGSGIRLLFLIAGLLGGGLVADRAVRRAGPRLVAGTGLAVMAAGLAFGAATTISTGDARAAAWILLSGLGLGLVLPTTVDAALGAVPGDASGVSSGVLQAMRTAAGAFGAAILGAVVNARYRDHLEHAVSPAQAHSVRNSAVAGVDFANGTGSEHLLEAVRGAFVAGMDRALWISAALMAAGAALAFVIRPARSVISGGATSPPHKTPVASPEQSPA